MLRNNKLKITYDEAKKTHAKFLFSLYNEPTINSIAVNEKGIIEMSSILKTIEFFSNTNNSLFIVSINGVNIGVGMIYDVSLEQNICSLGIVLNPEYRNKGWGTVILEDLIEIAKNSLNVTSIKAEINNANYKALKLVKNFNFKCINDKNSLSTYYIRTESFVEEDISNSQAIKDMTEAIKMSSFDDLVSVDEEDLKQAVGLEIDDDGNFCVPLAKDLDNDGITDRYDNDLKDSDYFESTYDVEDNLHAREEKPSILGQISKFKSEEEKDKNQEKSEKVQER